MTLAEVLLARFDDEMDLLARTLERLPAGREDFRPHPRARSAGELALHLATIPGWAGSMLDQDGYDLATAAPPSAGAATAAAAAGPPPARDAILALFAANRARARSAIARSGDDALRRPWRLMRAGRLVRAMERADAVGAFLLDHVIHHRGQLTVYLRLLDVPVPALYGASADEPG